jgi:hypothetical protein
MKKLITVLLLLTALYGTAFAQNASDFVVNAEGVITKYTGFDTVVVIPATIAGKKVTAIGGGAFKKADITSVTIPNGITYIYLNAFAENKLTSVTIPNSVMSIGESAFANNQITAITIPGSVKTISGGAFRNNTTLSTIVISEGVESIGNGAFANTGCKNVSLPSTLIKIIDDEYGKKDYAFDIKGKPSFTLAANINVEFAGYPMFYSYIANDRKAGTYAFDNQYVKKNADDYEYYQTQYGAVLIKYTGDSIRVRIPAEIGGVAVKALYGAIGRRRDGSGIDSFLGVFYSKSLTVVQIPEGITYIGNCAFYLNSLTSVTIPNGVTYIGDEAFCVSGLTSVTIPNGVTYIGNRAFYRNPLTSVTIPNSVTYIGNEAFYENQLTSVTIPNGVTYIGDNAFRKNKLTSIIIPNSVTSLRYGIFYENDNLTSVTFQGTITASNIVDSFRVDDNPPFPGDLHKKYLAGGRGRYTSNGAYYPMWTKQQ